MAELLALRSLRRAFYQYIATLAYGDFRIWQGGAAYHETVMIFISTHMGLVLKVVFI
jgi:hypothetical protein